MKKSNLHPQGSSYNVDKEKIVITDMLGNAVEISDYKAALDQAAEFASYHSTMRFSETVSVEEYWQDLYQKLLKFNPNNP